jgi:hypothetical protein
LCSGNAGLTGVFATDDRTGGSAGGGAITVAYVDLDGISTVNVTVGAGGAAGGNGSAGGRGEVIVEYVAG